jgi:hypothetical protein
MAHHGSELNQFNGEMFNRFFDELGGDRNLKPDEFYKNMPADQANKINEALKEKKITIGATGSFPDGKLTDGDEGEIKIEITQVDGRVVMNFGKPITWIGFTLEQAVQIAESLIKHSNENR